MSDVSMNNQHCVLHRIGAAIRPPAFFLSLVWADEVG